MNEMELPYILKKKILYDFILLLKMYAERMSQCGVATTTTTTTNLKTFKFFVFVDCCWFPLEIQLFFRILN